MTLMQLLFVLFLLMRASILKRRWVKWMLECCIGIVEKALLKLTTLTQISCNGLMLTFCPKHGWIDFITEQGAVSTGSNGWTSGKLKRFEIAWWLVSENLSKSVNNGSCAQHVVHGAFWKLEWSLQNLTLTKSWNQCSGCLKVRLLGAMSTWRKAFLESFLSGNNSIYNS